MPGSIYGNVVRADSGQAIPHATILGKRYEGAALVMGQTDSVKIDSLTDAAGWFNLEGLRPGQYAVQVLNTDNQAFGEVTVQVFNNATSNVTIEVRDFGMCGSDKINYGLTGTLRGRVVYADTGEPVSNASISIVRGSAPAPGVSPLSGSDGEFVFDELTAGEWVLFVLGPGGEIGQATVRMTAGSVMYTIIELITSGGQHMSGTVRGRVVSAKTGDPVANAAITVLRGPGPAPDISPMTDSTGAFVFDGLPVGECVLHALGPGGEIGEVTVDVNDQFVTDVLIKIKSVRSRQSR
jgi:Carboxypeptidase regulatory-like domain